LERRGTTRRSSTPANTTTTSCRPVFEELGIPEPAYDLGVGSASHGAQTAAMIDGLEAVVADVDPP